MRNEEARDYSARVMAELEGLADVALPDSMRLVRPAAALYSMDIYLT